MNYDMQDKVAFVTGASNGIGLATAHAFAASGARVVLTDLDVEAGLAAVHAIETKGGTAMFVRCDVSQNREVERAVQETIRHYGRLDYAFNNAGIEGESSPLSECADFNWNQVIDVNLKGVYLCMKFQIREMLKEGKGAIVNCSSIAGLVGFEGIAPYVASKHGVVGLTKAAALELAKSEIRVNAVCPGVIRTPMIERFTHGEAQAQKALIDGEPVGRLGEPEEVAAAVLWLCSTQSSFVTGQALAVDGGWVAR